MALDNSATDYRFEQVAGGGWGWGGLRKYVLAYLSEHIILAFSSLKASSLY